MLDFDEVDVITTSLLGRHKPPMRRHRAPTTPVPPLWSDTARMDDLVRTRPVPPMGDLPERWGDRWLVEYVHGKDTWKEPAAYVPSAVLLSADPIIDNTWHPGKQSRAGLRYTASTDLLNAHASKFERKFLLFLDFLGATEIAAQPFTLTYELDGKACEHTPDFMALVDGVPTVINCRPEELVKDPLLEDVSALGALGLSRGWDNVLVVGYPKFAYAALDSWSAHSTAVDHFGYSEEVVEMLNEVGPLTFGELTGRFESDVYARGVAQLMLWDRELVADLSSSFEDSTLVYLPGQVPGRGLRVVSETDHQSFEDPGIDPGSVTDAGSGVDGDTGVEFVGAGLGSSPGSVGRRSS